MIFMKWQHKISIKTTKDHRIEEHESYNLTQFQGGFLSWKQRGRVWDDDL